MIPNTLRKGLSMIELIMVIIVLGIVASIGAEIIANVYEGYLVQRAQHRASLKTELAATQIANRLAYAIPGTVVRKMALNDINPPLATDIDVPRADDPAILQWVGADVDSFNSRTAASILPAWSGFCDVDVSTETNIITPGSNTALIATIRGNLGLNQNQEIYFPTSNGLISAPVQNIVGTTITLNQVATFVDGGPSATTRVEHYKLASSSYALEANAQNELWLHYNFLPQKRVAIPNNGQSQLLLRNVTTFEFRGDGRTIRFKLCVNESIGDSNITICKEKAVF